MGKVLFAVLALASGSVTAFAWEDDKPILVPAQGVTCFLQGQQAAGMNKICYYNCLGSTAAITIGAAQLCPITINR